MEEAVYDVSPQSLGEGGSLFLSRPIGAAGLGTLAVQCQGSQLAGRKRRSSWRSMVKNQPGDQYSSPLRLHRARPTDRLRAERTVD